MLTGYGNMRTSILNVTNERKINNEKQHLISKKNLSVKKKIAWKEWKSAIVKKPYVNGLVNMRTLILDVTNVKEINK